MTTDPRIEAAARQVAVENGYPDFLYPDGMSAVTAKTYRDRAARILAAADNAATITTEWGTGLGDEVMTWKDRAQAERQSASATATYDQGKTWVHTNPPVVFRTLTDWKQETPDDHPTA